MRGLHLRAQTMAVALMALLCACERKKDSPPIKTTDQVTSILAAVDTICPRPCNKNPRCKWDTDTHKCYIRCSADRDCPELYVCICPSENCSLSHTEDELPGERMNVCKIDTHKVNAL